VLAVATVPALLSVATVARLLDCSPQTVRRRIAERELPAVRDHSRVMVRGDDLRAYVDGLERIGVRPGRRPRARGGGWDFLRAQ
jgi:excisionase family DNA binding protein